LLFLSHAPGPRLPPASAAYTSDMRRQLWPGLVALLGCAAGEPPRGKVEGCGPPPERVLEFADTRAAAPTCSLADRPLGLAVRGGTIYFSTLSGVCAADGSGVRVVTEGHWVSGLWLDGERVVYTDGVGDETVVEAAPLAGGPPVELARTRDSVSHRSFRGPYLYYLNEGDLRRLPLDGGAAETVVPRIGSSPFVVANDYVDYLPDSEPRSLLRVTLPPGAPPRAVQLLGRGDLLANDGTASWLVGHDDPRSLSDDRYGWKLYRVGPDGVREPSWKGEVPPLRPFALAFTPHSIFVGGWMPFSDGQSRAVVGRMSPAGDDPALLGCLPIELASWPEGTGTDARIDELLVDGNDVYALVRANRLTWSVIRFPGLATSR
jgi:hypothetical protein